MNNKNMSINKNNLVNISNNNTQFEFDFDFAMCHWSYCC